MNLWSALGFKQGIDERFHVSPDDQSTVYDTLGEMPRYDYKTEIQRYNEGRWRTGLIQNVLPSVCYCATAGALYGVFQSKRTLRHMSRPRVVVTHAVTCGTVALTTATIHHWLIVSSGYKQQNWHAMAAGMVGGLSFAISNHTSPSRSVGGGMLIGIFYSGVCFANNWYNKKSINNFLITQQALDTPVHRIAPEMQPMYRAFLYDHRPIEDSDELRRKALIHERSQGDTRLDAQAFLSAMDLWRSINVVTFPDWWPLKFPELTEEQKLLETRLAEDANRRRLNAIQSDSGSGLTDYFFRSKKHREGHKPDSM